MQKQIAIITPAPGTTLEDSLTRNLEEVLGGRMAIRNYSLNRLVPGERIEADLILALSRNRVLEMADYVADPRRIQVIERTIRRQAAHRIQTIPDGTRVLVVNDNPGSTTEMVALLHQLGMSHLQYQPFDPNGDCRNLRVAITPGERHLVPTHIKTVIDVGHRCLDLSTFIEIIIRLGISDPEIDCNLRSYADSIITLDRGVDAQFKELAFRNAELATVMDLSHDGILVLTPEGQVALCNRALAAMLRLPGPVVGATLAAFPTEVQKILNHRQTQECLLNFQGRSLAVKRQDLVCSGKVTGSYFNFQEVTRQPEPNIRGKLREKGQITRYTFTDLLTRSMRMQQCIALAKRVAPTDLTVLITGESGTGKELLAQSIHNASLRAQQPFVAVNCAAVPEGLLESELFGYQAGSFTGALKDGKAGLFEQAHNGTVFLDEIGDMPMPLQAKLLRVLQERQVVRVGSQNVISINIRVIAATNQDLRRRIRAGMFREDLFYRLNTLELRVPPLRDRIEDVFPLLDHFLGEQNRTDVTFTPEARSVLERHSWPGNIRELKNVAGHVAFMADAGSITVADLPGHLQEEVEAKVYRPNSASVAPGTDLTKVRAVLESLPTHSGDGPRRGRRAVQASLAARGLIMTECEVRKLLVQMSAMGLVRSWPGRRGSQVTDQGRLFLNGLQNGSEQAPIPHPYTPGGLGPSAPGPRS